MSSWVPVRHYASLFEAEMSQELLESEGIPVMLKGPITGVFGPGFSGATPQGVTLLVPDDRADEARELIADDDAASGTEEENP